ncbi:N-acetylneuraminate synthase family protein [uncultured Methanoregula sp.]|uniref:N-acetylneuraminate synthase family protein n=1 Tax=uncultured Methanoregula sp. TaxID=1005933 RepID=UPI002AAAAA7E|nr:N-acetylneuraminate synthase family protein [uncultured Methanoregula sp.]
MKVFVIAEVGINHNGDMEIAKLLIKAAKEAGCDAVKFQKRSIDIVYTKEFLDSPRDSPWGKTQRAQKEGLEFSIEQYGEIDRYCAETGIEWFASAWDLESQKSLRRFNCKYNKIASAMIVYEDLLKEVASEKKHTYISTGMSSIQQIDRAVEIFKKTGCPFELMHCVSTYPMDDEDANLNRIKSLRDRYNCNIGYSGHEVGGLAISCAATALGITSLERHITLDRAMYGSDQSASLEIGGLRMLVSSIRKIEKSMGTGEIQMQPKEAPIAKKLRAHVPWDSNE